MLSKKHSVLILILFTLFSISCSSTIRFLFQRTQAVPGIHSHNDYFRERPLYEALELHCASIEADVHLVDGALYVAHDEEDIVPEKTLKAIYLEPLRERIHLNNERIYSGHPALILFIDVKTDADSTYHVINELLSEYSDIVTSYETGQIQQKAINVIISGNRSIELLHSDTRRFARYDGRISDLGSETSSALIPIISDKWTEYFTWRGDGSISSEEQARLDRMVKVAHQEGRKIRFWDTDVDSLHQQIQLWEKLVEAKVDLINTDKLDELKTFLDGY